jgi:monomeric sarcosine oxidase
MLQSKTWDVVVVGAGVFGAWTALSLRRAGPTVLLTEAYGPGHSRASSGGESRVIRMCYGAHETYTRWSWRSLDLWKELFERAGRPLFHRTGVLWLAEPASANLATSQKALENLRIPFEKLGAAELRKRFAGMRIEEELEALFEPESGALLARRAVAATVEEAVRSGVEYRTGNVQAPRGAGRVSRVRLQSGEEVSGGLFVFACGPWLPKLFPALLEGRIRPTRQEVFFFGLPPDASDLRAPALPTWIDETTEYYGIPDLEGRGFKLAWDRHGPPFDPDSGERLVTREGIEQARAYLRRRFPAMAQAPLVESRVCQYENTSNGDFLIDVHPDHENLWLVGGGSGHGFKHGPALGEYVAKRIVEGGAVEAHFSLATKGREAARAIH